MAHASEIAISDGFVIRTTARDFERLAKQSPLKKVYVFSEEFGDYSLHSIDGFINTLDDCYPTQVIDIVKANHYDILRRNVRTLCASVRNNALDGSTSNALNIRNISGADAPRFTRLPQYRLLDFLVERCRKTWNRGVGKHAAPDPFDVAGCLR